VERGHNQTPTRRTINHTLLELSKQSKQWETVWVKEVRMRNTRSEYKISAVRLEGVIFNEYCSLINHRVLFNVGDILND
jgi:hypothetical protein